MPFKKGKSGRVARALAAQEPKVIEGAKRLLALRGPSTSEICVGAMKDLVMLKKPAVVALQRKNDIRPMEDASSLEFLANKNQCGAFLYVSHNKKRPHNMVLGRMYDGHVLDMIELGIVGYTPMGDIEGSKKLIGSYPCFVFAGDQWDRELTNKKLKNLLLDTFSARDITGVALPGIDHVVYVTLIDGVVYFRVYNITLEQADGAIPRTVLSPMGPFLDLVIRRTHFAAADLEKQAHKVPVELKAKKVKNVHKDIFGETHGQIHMQQQDFSKLELKKTKGAKSTKRGRGDAEGAAAAGAGGPTEDVDMDGEEALEMEEVPRIPSGKRARMFAGVAADADDE